MAVTGANRLSLTKKTRIQPRVDRDVVRLAKSKAAVQEITLEYAVEQLLKGWVSGKIKLGELSGPKS